MPSSSLLLSVSNSGTSHELTCPNPLLPRWREAMLSCTTSTFGVCGRASDDVSPASDPEVPGRADTRICTELCLDNDMRWAPSFTGVRARRFRCARCCDSVDEPPAARGACCVPAWCFAVVVLGRLAAAGFLRARCRRRTGDDTRHAAEGDTPSFVVAGRISTTPETSWNGLVQLDCVGKGDAAGPAPAACLAPSTIALV